MGMWEQGEGSSLCGYGVRTGSLAWEGQEVGGPHGQPGLPRPFVEGEGVTKVLEPGCRRGAGSRIQGPGSRVQAVLGFCHNHLRYSGETESRREGCVQ